MQECITEHNKRNVGAGYAKIRKSHTKKLLTQTSFAFMREHYVFFACLQAFIMLIPTNRMVLALSNRLE